MVLRISLRAFSRHSCLLKSYCWPLSSLTVRSNDQPGMKPAFSACGTTRGGEYISAILPLAVTSKADPTLSDMMSASSAKSSTCMSAALLRLLPLSCQPIWAMGEDEGAVVVVALLRLLPLSCQPIWAIGEDEGTVVVVVVVAVFGVSARSSTEVSAALLVVRCGGACDCCGGRSCNTALLELELPGVASINRSSSGSGVALFLFGNESLVLGGANFENAASLL